MTTSPAFSYARTVETDVPAAAIWALYEDARTWPLWDDQVQAVTRDGPFAAGTTGTMTFTGQAREVGPLITADFPKTMAALIALAGQRSAAGPGPA